MPAADEYIVDFPTLGFLGADWIEAHCPIPDGFRKGQPFVQADWQLWCTVNHYRIKPSAKWRPAQPVLAPSFHSRRSQVIAPQKTGKGPYSAAITCLEGAGPAVFAGWAAGGEKYRCRDHNCDCGWWYEYEPGEPMGMPWPTPLIQLFATTQEQVEDNVLRHLRPMVNDGPLSQFMRAGEEFVRIGIEGRIDSVTSNARARLGAPIIFGLFDEAGTYTETNKLKGVARTARRGLAGMGGRSMETSNAWDPGENSTAQQTYESLAADIFHFYREPPGKWDFKKKRDRRRILEYVYEGSPWVDLDSIEAEALELMEQHPEDAERFFGNIRVIGKGAWMPQGLWTSTERASS